MATQQQYSIEQLKTMLRKGNQHLRGMAQKMEAAWNPDVQDLRELHNMYARSLVCAYVSKFYDLSDGVLQAIDRNNYLSYALCGRGLIETTAVLRYNMLNKYKPLFDKGELTTEDMHTLISIDDKHLRGSRFDWESFLFKNYKKLFDDTAKLLKEKKQKKKPLAGC